MWHGENSTFQVWRKFGRGEGRGGYEEQEVGNVGMQELGKSGSGQLGCKEAGCRRNQPGKQGKSEADTRGCEETGCRGAKKQELWEVRKRILGDVGKDLREVKNLVLGHVGVRL